MDRSEIIYLISTRQKQDDLGQWLTEEAVRPVFCDVRSVSYSEWFEAGRNDMKPELSFVIYQYDYDGEKIVEYQGKRYGIYRTYVGTNDRLELYAESKGGVKSGK